MVDLIAEAKAISTSSSRIRAYAIDQATQFVALQKQVASIQVGAGGGAFWPRAQADFGGDLQKMIDAVPDGTKCWLEPGIYTRSDGKPVADTSAKNAIAFEALGGSGFDEGGRWGAVVRATTDGVPAIQDLGFGSEVKHAGPKWEHVNFHALAHVPQLVKLRQVNHWLIREGSSQGAFDVAIDIDVPVSQYGSGDNAYSLIEHHPISATLADKKGVRIGDGYVKLLACNFDMTGNNPVGLHNERGVFKAVMCKWNHAGHHILSSGSDSHAVLCDFEIAPWTGVYAVEILNSGWGPPSGRRHTLIANTFTPHAPPAGQYAKLVHFGPGTGACSFDFSPSFYNDAKSVWDEGAGNTVRVL